MKKCLVLFLSLLLMIVLVSGCKSDSQSPLTICIDIKDLIVIGSRAEIASVQLNAESNAAELFRRTIIDHNGPEDVEFEFIPATGQEREAVISRIRTEIISGKGPDVFIVNCANDAQTDALFQSPGAIMALNLFLPLDNYIEKAQYMEWDKFNQVVMAAGKNETGQQLLPLSYTFPVSVCKKQDIPISLSKDMTLYDMLDSESEAAAFALTNSFYRHAWSDYAFGFVADYAKGELLFTEEDLVRWENAQQKWHERSVSGEFENAPSHYSMSMNVGFDLHEMHTSEFFQNISKDDELTFVPMYNTQGGVTATVLSFAGINRNTKRADDAFRVLDALLDRSIQQYSEIFTTLTNLRGIPVHQELMQEDYPVAGWYMNDNLYQEFCNVRNQITVAKFRTVFENELFNLDTECFRGTDIEQAVAKAYTTMKMIIAES